MTEVAEVFVRAVRGANIDEILAFIDADGVSCGDATVARATVERQLQTKGTWLHAYFLDPPYFAAHFADGLFTTSFGDLVAQANGLILTVPPGQEGPVACVNFSRSKPAYSAQLCFLRKRNRWVLHELPNCA